LRYCTKNLIEIPLIALLYQLTHYIGTLYQIRRTEPQSGSFQRYNGSGTLHLVQRLLPELLVQYI
jgi:hypothetical protein